MRRGAPTTRRSNDSSPRCDRRSNMTFLKNGEAFPSLTTQTVGGGTMTLPSDLAGSFGVVLLYRGSWCPYCKAQLTAFSRAQESLAALDVKVVALSVDDEPTSAAFTQSLGIRFPIGHSADVDGIAAITGAYTNESPKYFQ